MDPLAVVEAQLGSIDSWPSYVLRHIYAEAQFTRKKEGSSVYVREQRKTE